MSEYTTKVHRNPGGDVLVVESGGKIEIKEGGEVTGLTGAAALATAAATVLGGIKAAASTPETDTVECKIAVDKKLYVPTYPTIPQMANQTALDGAAVLADVITAFNTLVAALITAGLMADAAE